MHSLKKQTGAASLLTALVLLICITLVILLTAKTVLVETQITADNYRTSQATAAASAAMNQGIAYFMEGGMDQDGDDAIDFAIGSPFAITLTSTSAQFYFDITTDNACDCAGGGCLTNTTNGMIVAQGWSDDTTATRTITQCLTTFDIFDGGEGPKQPFISRESVGVAGNARIINRYTNSTIWAGGSLGTSGASFGTYLRPSGTSISEYSESELNDEDETADTQRVSDRDSGAGIDIITDDPTLGATSSDEMFDLFFAMSKNRLQTVATNIGQKYDPGDDVSPATPLTGVVWVGNDDGSISTTDTTISGTDVIGSPDNPVVLVVNGDVRITGGTVYGVIYVMGDLTVTGNPILKGTLISESGDSFGAGTLNLVYVPYGDTGDNSPTFIAGTGAVLSGSWKDW